MDVLHLMYNSKKGRSHTKWPALFAFRQVVPEGPVRTKQTPQKPKYMGNLILTAYAEQPSVKGVKTYAATVTPKIVHLEPSEVADISPKKDSAGVVVGSVIVYGASKKVRRKYLVAERPQEVAVAQDPVTTNPYAQSMDLAVTAAGAASNTGTQLSKYLNKVTAATVTTTMGVILPSASETKKAVVVINSASTAISVYPKNAENIGTAASNIGVSLAVGGRAHFYAFSTTNWRQANALL